MSNLAIDTRWGRRRGLVGRSQALSGLSARSVLAGDGHEAHDLAATKYEQFGGALRLTQRQIEYALVTHRAPESSVACRLTIRKCSRTDPALGAAQLPNETATLSRVSSRPGLLLLEVPGLCGLGQASPNGI